MLMNIKNGKVMTRVTLTIFIAVFAVSTAYAEARSPGGYVVTADSLNVRLAANETGKITVGTKTAIKDLMTHKPKVIIISSNCENETLETINHYAKLAEVPTYQSDKTSLELGEILRKPFPVSIISVHELGDLKLSKFKK